MRAVEDAIARQVFHGGDLATNLLEVAVLREDVLMPLVAESFGLEPAAPGRLAPPSPDVLRLVPGDLALRHGMYPLALRDRALVVAVAEPLPAAVEDDLGFALDLAIRQVVAPLVRVRQAIAESYGIPLDRRHLRLVAKLDGKADPSPSAAPPPDRDALPAMKMPQQPVSIPSPSFGTGVNEPEPSRLGELPPSKATLVTPPSGFASPRIPRSPALPTAMTARPAPSEPEPEPAGDLAAAEHAEPVPVPAPPAPPPMPKSAARALAGVLQQALREERVDKNRTDWTREGEAPGAGGPSKPGKAARAAPLWQAGKPRRKGPFTAAMAEEELEEAAASDAVLGIFFAFAQQFFRYAALFVVHGELAEGHDASGPGADKAAVSALRVPLDEPGSLARARDRRGPVIGKLGAEGRDALFAADLGRAPRARAVALLPIVVRGRAVAILYGDDGDADVELSSIGDVIAMIGLAGSALERIALRRKLGSRAPEVPHKVRIQDGAAALARAISVSAMAAVSAPVPPEPPAPEPPPPERAPTPPPPEPAFLAIDPAAIPVPPEAPAVAMFSAAEPERPPTKPSPAGGVEELPSFAVSPPEIRKPARPRPPHRALLRGPSGAEARDRPRRRHPVPGLGPRPRRKRAARGAAGPVGADAPDVGGGRRAGIGSRRAPRGAPHGADGAGGHASLPRAAGPGPALRRPLRLGAGRGLRRMGRRRGEGGAGRQAARGRAHAPLDGVRAAAVHPAAERDRVDELPLAAAPAGDRRDRQARAVRAPPDHPARGGGGELPPLRHPPGPDGGRHPYPPARPAPSKPAASTPPPAGSSSVVVDSGVEPEELIQRVIEGGPRGQEAFDQLVRHGDHVIAAVMGRFPGPLRVDRHRARAELPAASQCGPILELAVAIRRAALPFVSSRSISTDAEIRFWATHVLGELRYPEAATVLVPRLFDDDASVRRIARRSAAALVSAGSPGGPILKGLEDITKNPDEGSPNRVLAIETMGEIRSGSVVPPLLSALEGAPEDVADAARRALLLITRQDFGRDARRWQEWWGKNGARHRIEWLIDALMHDQPSVRRAAGDELKLLTKEYFGYYDDLPRRERERAQGLYRSWWEREGRLKF